MPKTKFKIALMIETSGSYGRGVLRGIARYSHLHGPWSFHVLTGHTSQNLPDMASWKGNGIIGRMNSPELLRAVAATGLPAIGLDIPFNQSSYIEGQNRISEVHPDPDAMADMAVNYLIKRGFRQFAFVGEGDRIWSTRRQDAVSRRVAEEGLPCHIYPCPETDSGKPSWDTEAAIMEQWVKELPKPIALIASNDERGREVLDAALEAGIAVPDDLAILGVDNDDILCDLCDPPLSSIEFNTMKVGFEVAKLMEELITGKRKKPKNLLAEPLGVVTRRSTNVFAMEDRKVAQAIGFIRDHAADPIHVPDVLKAVPISRRALELRFKQVMKHSINEEILLAHLQRAKELLCSTNLPVEEIAYMSGFSSCSYMGDVFKKRLQTTPARYRRHVQR